jgi:ubiquitin-conjugating enzyme E2 Q
MPPPFESSPSATMAVQRELKTMLKEQDKAMMSPGGLKELGWYMPQESMIDSLFQWIVEMHSFDETLPIAKDLKSTCLVFLSSKGASTLIFSVQEREFVDIRD